MWGCAAQPAREAGAGDREDPRSTLGVDTLSVRWVRDTDQFTRPRAWIFLTLGLLVTGTGIAMMLSTNLGVSPVDVFFSGTARTLGVTVGTVIIGGFVLMIAVTWPFGLRPSPGTFACILLLGPAVDAATAINTLIGVPTWGLPALVAWWALGMVVFATGIVALFGSIPYDHLALATARVTRRSVPLSRLMVDAVFLVSGVLLGGSWGAGTIVLVLVMPVALRRVLPRVRSAIGAPAGFKPPDRA